MSEAYLGTKEACQYLGISRTTLNVYVREGRLKQYEQQVPRRTVYKQSELESLKQIRRKS
jgi:predicted site-specific integrase-resolvase